jgi:hypothetical protein
MFELTLETVMLLAMTVYGFWILLIHGHHEEQVDAGIERFAVVGVIALSIAFCTPQSVQAPINFGLRAMVDWALH